jgi:hypothetical protein
MAGEKEQLMKNLQQLVLVAIIAALACAGLHAQTANMRATIPFDFYAGDRLLPAGEYIVHQQGPWVSFRDAASGRPSSMLMTISTEGRGPSHARLEFNRYGSEYFLSEVWNAVTVDGRQLVQAPRQKELAKRGAPAPASVIISSSK